MRFFCWLWLHSWESKTKLVEKSWFLVRIFEQGGFQAMDVDPNPIDRQEISVPYKECRRCGVIKPR